MNNNITGRRQTTYGPANNVSALGTNPPQRSQWKGQGDSPRIPHRNTINGRYEVVLF